VAAACAVDSASTAICRCLSIATGLGIGFKHAVKSLESGAQRLERSFSDCIGCFSSQLTLGVLAHMNTKMILAALALSLSLAGCAKKEEPAEAATDAAAAAGEAATDASAAAGDAASAATDAASAATDAASAAAPADAAAPAPAEAPKP
jgi:hypothetical protein